MCMCHFIFWLFYFYIAHLHTLLGKICIINLVDVVRNRMYRRYFLVVMCRFHHFSVTIPSQPNKLLVVMVCRGPSPEIAASIYVVSFSAASFHPKWPTSTLPKPTVRYLLQSLHNKGRMVVSPSFVTCRVALRCFGPVLVLDLHERLIGDLPVAPTSIPVLRSSQADPKERKKQEFGHSNPKVPGVICLKIILCNQAEIDSLFSG